jgi:hypothetical protein
MSESKQIKNSKEYTKWNSRYELWSYNKFQSLEPYEINRRTEERVNKVIKVLKERYLPTHSQIAVGRIVNPWGRYKQNDLVRLNGNTRDAAMKMDSSLIPEVPFEVNIIDIHSKVEGDALYYSYDSPNAVETSSDKCTGLLREKDYEALSAIIIKGKYKTSVEKAGKYSINDRGQYVQKMDFKEQLDYFWDEIRYLDTKHIDKLPRYTSNTFSALLMICKKYGVNHPRVDLLIDNLFNGVTTTNDGVNVDGAHHIYYDLYSELGRMWSTTSRSFCMEIIGKILFDMDAFIKNETINKKNLKKLKVEDHRKFYQFYLLND